MLLGYIISIMAQEAPMNLEEIQKLAGSVLIAVGGVGSLMFGGAKYFGGIWANKLLERDKFKYSTELEQLKSNYTEKLESVRSHYTTELEGVKAKYSQQLEAVKLDYSRELETHKSDLDKAKSRFMRYSETQFAMYNKLWQSLCDLKYCADELWDKASQRNLVLFVKQVKKTHTEVQKNRLIIEDEHYNRLNDLFNELKNYEIGKKNLLEFANENNLDGSEYQEFEWKIIQRNGTIRQRYSLILDNISQDFRKQIKGG
jgi:hypothetical protein